MAQPFLVFRHRGLVIREIDDARALEADIRADALVHRLPQALGFERHGNFAGVAVHHAHPAPVASRLLVADIALLANRDGNTPLRKFQRGGDADDPPPMIATSTASGSDGEGAKASMEIGTSPPASFPQAD